MKKILVIDDNPITTRQLVHRINSHSSKNGVAVGADSYEKMIEFIEFGIKFDGAFIDLTLEQRSIDEVSLEKSGNEKLLLNEYSGLRATSHFRATFPHSYLVGYSSSFNMRSDTSNEKMDWFVEQGANEVADFFSIDEKIDAFLSNSIESNIINKPTKKVFIGCSGDKESLAVAREIQNQLEEESIEVTLWNQGVFRISQTSINSLLQAREENEFGIFVFSPTDKTSTGKQEEFYTVRDNVVFESGLFIGTNGLEKTYIVAPKAKPPHILTDLKSVGIGFYDEKKSLNSALGKVCNEIRDRINAF